MARRALLAALVALAGACQLDPAGRCDARIDCAPGLDCLNGVCAACRGDFDCSGWESCGGDGLCAPLEGRCDADADCASWNRCDGTHTCVLRADHCDAVENPICGALYWTCDPEHHCSLLPGKCNADADCSVWMASCDVASHACLFPATVGDDVLAWGTLAEGRDDRIAVARPAAPEVIEVGFDAGAAVDGRAFIDPVTGALVYRHAGDAGGDTLRRFNRDAIDPVGGLWRYPAEPSADDELAIDPAACPDSWSDWLMRGGTGALLYGCPVAGGSLRDYRDAAGTVRLAAVQGALAWSPNDHLLVRDATGVLRVFDEAGAGGADPITGGLPAGTILAQRTTAAGFRVAVRRDDDGTDQLWEIDDATRVATLLGGYVTATAYAGLTWDVMDSDGTLYGRAYVGVYDIVLKRPVAAGTASKVYDEADTPPGANDFTAETFAPWLRLDRSFLFTRP